MKVAITADHRGAMAQAGIRELVQRMGHELIEVPTCTDKTSCDYPDMAYHACTRVSNNEADRAILLCGSGIGMSIAANKIKAIRAALVHDDVGAELSRSHNDSNVICLSADMLGQREMEKIVTIWLETPFEGGRHARRVNKILAMENGDDPGSVTE